LPDLLSGGEEELQVCASHGHGVEAARHIRLPTPGHL
jgi:hypothetical protein